MSKCSFAALRSRTGSHSLKGFVLGPRLQSKSERAALWTNTDGHLKVEKHYRRQTSPRETSGTLKSIFSKEASQLKPRKKGKEWWLVLHGNLTGSWGAEMYIQTMSRCVCSVVGDGIHT